MLKFLKNHKFAKSEDGAVTVDWVVLSAAIVGLGIAAVNTTSTGVNTAAANISSGLANQPVGGTP